MAMTGKSSLFLKTRATVCAGASLAILENTPVGTLSTFELNHRLGQTMDTIYYSYLSKTTTRIPEKLRLMNNISTE